MVRESQVVHRQQIRGKILEYDRLSFWTLVKGDLGAYHGCKRAVLCPGFWIGVAYRIGHWFYKHRADVLAMLVQCAVNLFSSCDISRKALIGPGLTLYHPRNIFVGPGVWIGAYCQLGPQVFLGSNLHPYDLEDYPVIDDGLAMAVGGVILGGVTLGRRVNIGPNTVVLKDIQDRCNVMPPPSHAVPRKDWEGKESFPETSAPAKSSQ